MRPLRLFILAGEPSGDILAAALVERLAGLAAQPIQLLGVGGEHLQQVGLRPLFAMQDLSVMGLVEILPRLPRLRRRLAETVDAVISADPDLLLTVDSPGFNLRLLRRLAGHPVPKVHYVAPQAWAWRPGRAVSLAGLADRLLALLPFEPPFFARYGVEASFVGHPAVERIPSAGEGRHFLARHGLGDASPVILLLPGSRRQEWQRHLPIFGQAAALLRHDFPRLRAVLVAGQGAATEIAATIARWPLRPVLVSGETDRRGAFACADLALTASGTVTLELGLAGVPMVVAHRLNPLTGLIAARLIRVPHVALVNLVLDAAVAPELLQSACTAGTVAATARQLLRDRHAGAAQRAALSELRQRLVPAGGEPPSLVAARAALAATGRTDD